MLKNKFLFIFFITFSILSLLFIDKIAPLFFPSNSTLDLPMKDVVILSNNDTDNDGYTDLQEQHFGSDINDNTSVIYTGGWPYNTEKDSMIDIGFRGCSSIPYGNGCECTDDSQCMEGSKCEILFTSQNCVPKEGAQLPQLIGIDQFGDYVDLYDFANQDKLILIEVSTMWAKASNTMAEWLSGNPETIETMRWWQDNFNEVKALIDSGDIYYIRVLHQGSVKDDIITPDDITYWYDAYPHPNIVNISDPDAYIKTWVRPTGYPALMLFNPDLTIHTPSEGKNGDAQRRRGLKAPFEAVIQYFQK